MLRIASYRIHQSLVEKPLSLDDYWKIDEVKEMDEMIMTPDLFNEIKKKHGLS